MKDKHKVAYMKCCKAFAECSDDTRLHVGTVIVKNNRIISCGYNAHTQHITAPNQLSDGTTDPRVRHSEKNALMGLILARTYERYGTRRCGQSKSSSNEVTS